MNITKYSHCCMRVEEQGTVIVTDPGMFNVEEAKSFQGIHVLLITHEHSDHLHTDAVRTIIANNSSIRIITNSAVAAILQKEGITSEVVEHGSAVSIRNILIEGFGEKHAEIYKTIPSVMNTGYLINKTLFFPGDALTNPGKPIKVLAVPVVGPWLKSSEAVEYVLEIHPAICFPVHDAITSMSQFYYRPLLVGLEGTGVEFIVLEKNQTREF